MKIIPSEYLVTFDDGDEYQIIISFEKKDQHLWKIYDCGYVLNKELKWVFETSPSNRTEEFLYTTRHKFEDACLLLNKRKDKDLGISDENSPPSVGGSTIPNRR